MVVTRERTKKEQMAKSIGLFCVCFNRIPMVMFDVFEPSEKKQTD